ncbi:MAG: acyl-CoA dehydrogenase [Burkholderiaceae bacterium]
MSFHVPLHDMQFCLDELAGLDDILALPGFESFSPDLVQAVLNENARFVEGVLAPLNRVGDTQPPMLSDGHVQTSPGFADAFRQYAQGGWQGLAHPEKWGGQGLPKVVAATSCEAINAANMAFSLCPLLTDGVIEALLTAGNDAQRARYVPSLIAGEWTGTMNLTEPQAGSDLAQVATRAVPQDNGTYRITGQKIYITFGEHDMAENIVHLVLARTPDAPAGVKGISLFIVPKYLVDEQGATGARNDVWCASLEHKLGIHGSPTAVLLYGSGKGDVGEGAVGELVGQENRGLEYMFIMMNAARFAVGQQGIALCERAYQHALSYARERVQGRAIEGSSGPVAIVHHPDVQRQLLTMRALTEASRAVAYVAAGACDRSRHHADPLVRTREQAIYEYLVPVVKGFSTETSVEVASLGVQVHGGMGFIEETGAAQFYRDARILPIYEGTTAIQANDLVGRKTLRDGGQTAHAFVAAMRETLAALELASQKEAGASLKRLHAPFSDAIDAYEQGIGHILAFAQTNIRAAFGASVPYLMLCGVVHGGWQMVRSALVVAGEGDARGTATRSAKFDAEKLATATFYAVHILPRARAFTSAIETADVADQAGSMLTGH